MTQPAGPPCAPLKLFRGSHHTKITETQCIFPLNVENASADLQYCRKVKVKVKTIHLLSPACAGRADVASCWKGFCFSVSLPSRQAGRELLEELAGLWGFQLRYLVMFSEPSPSRAAFLPLPELPKPRTEAGSLPGIISHQQNTIRHFSAINPPSKANLNFQTL